MSEFVLDASAVLALLNQEEGADTVRELLPQAALLTVNQAEVATRLSAAGMPEEEIRVVLSLLGVEVIPFDEELAIACGVLYPKTRASGLSLGDRACLALTARISGTAVSADQAWGNLDPGFEILLIR